MYSVPYFLDDVSDQTDSALVDKAGDGDHIKYCDHLGILTTKQSMLEENESKVNHLQQMAIVLKLHSKDGQTVRSSAQVVSEVLELFVHEADIVNVLRG